MTHSLEKDFRIIKDEVEKFHSADHIVIGAYGEKIISVVATMLFIVGLFAIGVGIHHSWFITTLGALVAATSQILATYPYRASRWSIVEDLALIFFNGKIEQEVYCIDREVAQVLNGYGLKFLKQMKQESDWRNIAEEAETILFQFREL